MLHPSPADGNRPRRRGQRPLALTRLLPAAHIALLAESALGRDVPAFPVGGDGRDFAHPAFPPSWGSRPDPKRLDPTFTGLNCLVGQRTGALLHGLVSLGQCSGHLGVVDTLCSGDEPRD